MFRANNAVRMAVAAVMSSAAATGANALDISTYNSSVVNVFLSGSTAVDNTLVNTTTELTNPGGLCQANTIDIYYIGTTSSYSNRMIFCSAASTTGLTAGTPLAIYKESTAGSANAVAPLIAVAKGGVSGLSFINATALKASTDTACTTANVAATATNSAYVNHSSCPAADVSTNVVPTGGFADVEAAILESVTGSSISASDASTYLTNAPTVDQVWAVLVSKQAYYALQTAEALGSKCVTGVDDPHCAPSLSKQQVSGLLDGNIFSWSQLGLNNATGSDNQVYVCRRDYASGTEASFEAYFTGARCSKSSEDVLPEDGFAVWANGSAGGVRTCMQTFQNGGTQTSYYNQDGTYTSGGATNPFKATEVGNQWAIGINNTEITAANLSSASDSFRVVAVDGVLPQLANVQNGFWPYFSTGNAYSIAPGKTGTPTSNPLTVWNAVKKYIGNPTFTADSNKSYESNAWGPAGDISPAAYAASGFAPTLPATDATAEVNPTNGFTKTASGTINNCDIPQYNYANDTESSPETNLLGTDVVNPD